VPLPWSGQAPPFGFTAPGASQAPWLPQPEAWRALTVERQAGDPESMLELYRAALRIRREHPALGDGRLSWESAAFGSGVLAFTREPGFCCVVNFSGTAVELPPRARVLLASAILTDGAVPVDTAVWLDVDDIDAHMRDKPHPPPME
jgi:alpha-glucosidase